MFPHNVFLLVLLSQLFRCLNQPMVTSHQRKLN